MPQALPQITAEVVLINHQRRDIGSCICGWAKLGASHAKHQVQALVDAGFLAPAAAEAVREVSS